MRRNCPITGDTAKVVESVDRIIVEHSKLGRYTLDTNALSELEVDAEIRERIVHWIAESQLTRYRHSQTSPLGTFTFLNA